MIKAVYIIFLTCAFVLAQLPDSTDTQKVADSSDTAEYHYFIDSNKNGIDDRLEQESQVKQSGATDEKNSKCQETKSKSSQKNSEKKTKETQRPDKKQNNQYPRPSKRR